MMALPSVDEILTRFFYIVSDSKPHAKVQIEQQLIAQFGLSRQDLADVIGSGRSRFGNLIDHAQRILTGNLKRPDLALIEKFDGGRTLRISPLGVRLAALKPPSLSENVVSYFRNSGRLPITSHFDTDRPTSTVVEATEPSPEVEDTRNTIATESDYDYSAGFRIERNLHNALIPNLAQLEDGLVFEASERPVQSGRIDILAHDSVGRAVVIELKAGIADEPVLSQVLRYISSLEDEGETREIRGIVIAEDFSHHLILSARRVPGLELIRYSYRFKFEPVGTNA